MNDVYQLQKYLRRHYLQHHHHLQHLDRNPSRETKYYFNYKNKVKLLRGTNYTLKEPQEYAFFIFS